ncbi:MAG: hypothetical protein JWO44_512 [Bacteroidetes bacterium]|nr:hypothetical protein [Bacteroidota bacterium]
MVKCVCGCQFERSRERERLTQYLHPPTRDLMNVIPSSRAPTRDLINVCSDLYGFC